MICPECNGSRWITKTDIMRATTRKERCEFCKGVGEIQDQRPTGLTVKPEAGQILYFQWVDENRRVKSVMTVAVEGIVPPNSPQDKYCIVKIMNMKTRHAGDRKKGYMGKILEGVKKFANGQVKFIVTSWFDSTKEGKNFLLKRGFVREQNQGFPILIWRRDAKPTENNVTGSGDNAGSKDNRSGNESNKD